MKYFCVHRRFDMGVSYSLCDERPRAETKEERRRVFCIRLNDAGDKLTLSEATALFKSGELESTATYRVPDIAPVKVDPAKAFAKYREARTIYPTLHPFQDHAERRREIIAGAQARRDAVVAIGRFINDLGAYLGNLVF
jgi:hypothetical protein